MGVAKAGKAETHDSKADVAGAAATGANAAGVGAVRAPHVLVAVSGGIAAYKACEVVRGLQKGGCDVRVTMTVEAEKFVGTATFDALTGHRTLTGLFESGHDIDDPIAHITAAEWADAALVVPATANIIAKIACGIADDALTTAIVALPSDVPLLVAPAMNVHMWHAAATQANVRTLAARGVHFVYPATGRLACGDVGEGKLAPVEQIVGETLAALRESDAFTVGIVSAIAANSGLAHDGGNSETAANSSSAYDAAVAANSREAITPLAGTRIVVTAGPTHEPIDPVRFIGNRSSGKMGFAIAAAAAAAGADVTLVAGPCQQPTPDGVTRVDVETAADMYKAATAAFTEADAAICAAAVADYTPAHPADHKLKKGREELDRIDLVRTVDILAELSAHKGSRVVVGFAAETDDLIANAQDKLARKGCDLIVANDVSRADSTFGSETDQVTFVTAAGTEQLPTLTKQQVADEIVKRIVRLIKK